jgi:hypothetical protein
MTSSEEEEGVWTFDVVYKSGTIVNKFKLILGNEENLASGKKRLSVEVQGPVS